MKYLPTQKLIWNETVLVHFSVCMKGDGLQRKIVSLMATQNFEEKYIPSFL